MYLEDVRQDIIEHLRPMSELVDLGVIYMLNRDYFIPKGFLIVVYVDENDGKSALGWACLDLETAQKTGITPDQPTIDKRQKAFDSFEC